MCRLTGKSGRLGQAATRRCEWPCQRECSSAANSCQRWAAHQLRSTLYRLSSGHWEQRCSVSHHPHSATRRCGHYGSDHIQHLRQQAVAHVKRHPDLNTGCDSCRARIILAWWLASERIVSKGASWPCQVLQHFHFCYCGEVKPVALFLYLAVCYTWEEYEGRRGCPHQRPGQGRPRRFIHAQNDTCG